jgi:formylglycine-generating enzyme required for sulfatase activity
MVAVMRRSSLFFIAMLLGLAACESTEESGETPDQDAEADAAPDAISDAPPDVPDASEGGVLDAQPDAAPEVPEGYVVVEPGTFSMGSAPQEPGRSDAEAQHTVTLTRPFVMKKTEVTQAEWETVMGYQPSYFAGCETCPVEYVSWWEAIAYCNALSAAEGLAACYELDGCTEAGPDFVCDSITAVGGNPLLCEGYRLPTEAEWEYAARAGSTTAFAGGEFEGEPDLAACEVEAALDTAAWYCANSGDEPHPVAGKSENAWGLHDTAGNVLEWVWDRYAPYETAEATDPWVDGAEGMRVLRGGSWSRVAAACRSAAREGLDPAERDGDTGLRPVRSVLP